MIEIIETILARPERKTTALVVFLDPRWKKTTKEFHDYLEPLAG
ncbi:MAG: hypothetical protein ACR2NF_04695 [Pirellulales bacterium]|jgi:hypothetical protein